MNIRGKDGVARLVEAAQIYRREKGRPRGNGVPVDLANLSYSAVGAALAAAKKSNLPMNRITANAVVRMADAIDTFTSSTHRH